MASNLDSSAVFAARAIEVGLLPAELDRLKGRAWDTFGKLAVAVAYNPGQPDDSAILKLAAFITGVDSIDRVPEDRVPVIRRLHFEAYSYAAADLRTRVDRRDDDPPKKLAAPERASRHLEQMRRLPGLHLRGELEPSHALVDLAQDILDSNQFVYIRWEQCTKRDQELMNVRLDPIWKPDSRGIVKETSRMAEIMADTSTDLLLCYALQRRALALDQCNLISYELMHSWTQVMLSAYLKEPPSGYRRVSLEQLHNADLELCKSMMTSTASGVRPPLSGPKPLEEAFHKHFDTPTVRLHLQPLPGSSSSSSTTSGGQARGKRKRGGDTGSDELDRLRRQVANLEGRLNNAGGGKGGRSSGKGKGKKGGVQTPPELRGLEARGPDGENRCYNFNMGGCTQAKPGQRCPRGMHVCMRPGCGKPHGQRDHPE